MNAKIPLFIVAALVPPLASCGGAVKPSIAPAPPNAAVAIDGEWVTIEEMDGVAAFLLETVPAAGKDTARWQALEAALFPRALARHDFPKGVAEAREKAAVAMSMLRDKQIFEDVRAQLSEAKVPAAPLPIPRRRIDPLLGAAVFGKPAGYVTPQPIETTYAFVIARVDLPDPEAGPAQERVILSTIERFYDPTIAESGFRLAWARRRMLEATYVLGCPEAFDWIPPFLRSKVPDPRVR